MDAREKQTETYHPQMHVLALECLIRRNDAIIAMSLTYTVTISYLEVR